MKYYECRGDVRGNCGKHHRSLIAAVKHLKQDQAGCQKRGMYSDRYVTDEKGVIVHNGFETLPPTE